MTTEIPMVGAEGKTSTEDLYANKRYRCYVLGLLTLVYAFNFIDRQLLVILQESIKHDLSLSDSQLGLMTGFAFAIFYVVMGIPIARLADRSSRSTIIAVAIGIWSFMTAISGMAQNFVQLLLARIGVGVGEAGCSPPAHSIISDVFPEEKRARAFAIYNMGISIGIMGGYLLGGWINEIYGWRVAFAVIGLPGVLIALVVKISLREPPRGLSEKKGVKVSRGPAEPIKDVLAQLFSRLTYRHLCIASALHTLVVYGSSNWVASFMIRIHGMGTGELGSWLAIAVGLFGALGGISGGWLADKKGATDKRWYLWIPAFSTLAFIPFGVITYMVDDVYIALISYCAVSFVSAMYLAPVLAVAMRLAGANMRAMSSAVLFFIMNLIGMGLGPWLIGYGSDQFAPSLGVDSLRYSLVALICIGGTWCVFHYLKAAAYLREDIENAPV